MPEFLPQGYSIWCWTASKTTKFHSFIPRFFFLSLSHQDHVWTNDLVVKDCRVTFPVMLDMAPYPFVTKNWYLYRLAVGISHPVIPRTMKVITWYSSEYSADGFDWMTLVSRQLRSRQRSKTTSWKQRDILNCHDPALRGTQRNKSFSTQFLNRILLLSPYKSSSIDLLINLSRCWFRYVDRHDSSRWSPWHEK
jgi:hypothetical protein